MKVSFFSFPITSKLLNTDKVNYRIKMKQKRLPILKVVSVNITNTVYERQGKRCLHLRPVNYVCNEKVKWTLLCK